MFLRHVREYRGELKIIELICLGLFRFHYAIDQGICVYCFKISIAHWDKRPIYIFYYDSKVKIVKNFFLLNFVLK